MKKGMQISNIECRMLNVEGKAEEEMRNEELEIRNEKGNANIEYRILNVEGKAEVGNEE